MPDADNQNTRSSANEDNPSLQSRRERKRGEGRRVRPWMIVVGVLTAMLLAVGGYGAYRYNRVARALAPEPSVDATRARQAVDPIEPAADKDKQEPVYILILGEDRRPGQKRARSDTILIARVDPDTQKVSMLSIPRDTRVRVPGHGMDKITHANAYGGPALTIETVKDFTGLPINHYMEVDFEGFTRVVDLVGGVTVKLDRAINDKKGASSSGGVSNVTYIPAGKQTLNGQQALTFVRSRQFADGDFTRIKHQQQFLTALIKKATSAKNLPKLPSIAEQSAGNVDTDMTIPELLAMATAFKGMTSKDIEAYTAPGKPGRIGGVSYVLPNEKKAAELFRQFAEGTVPEKSKDD